MPMIRARCCSWPPAGFARTWVVPRRVLALTRAFQTWSRPSKHRQARADCNTSIISVGRFPGERGDAYPLEISRRGLYGWSATLGGQREGTLDGGVKDHGQMATP